MSETKRREDPRVCDKHAQRHADAACQANCLACGDCYLSQGALLESVVAALRGAERIYTAYLNARPQPGPEMDEVMGAVRNMRAALKATEQPT